MQTAYFEGLLAASQEICRQQAAEIQPLMRHEHCAVFPQGYPTELSNRAIVSGSRRDAGKGMTEDIISYLKPITCAAVLKNKAVGADEGVRLICRVNSINQNRVISG